MQIPFIFVWVGFFTLSIHLFSLAMLILFSLFCLMFAVCLIADQMWVYVTGMIVMKIGVVFFWLYQWQRWLPTNGWIFVSVCVWVCDERWFDLFSSFMLWIFQLLKTNYINTCLRVFCGRSRNGEEGPGCVSEWILCAFYDYTDNRLHLSIYFKVYLSR